MSLRNERTSLWLGLLAILVALVVTIGLTGSMAGTVNDIADPVSVSLLSFFIFLMGGLTVMAFLDIPPSLSFLSMQRKEKSSGYEILPVYYSQEGPHGSDAVICLVRLSGELEWQPQIVALNHFIPEEAEKIRDLFNLETGEVEEKKIFAVKTYRAPTGVILRLIEIEQKKATTDTSGENASS